MMYTEVVIFFVRPTPHLMYVALHVLILVESRT